MALILKSFALIVKRAGAYDNGFRKKCEFDPLILGPCVVQNITIKKIEGFSVMPNRH